MWMSHELCALSHLLTLQLLRGYDDDLGHFLPLRSKNSFVMQRLSLLPVSTTPPNLECMSQHRDWLGYTYFAAYSDFLWILETRRILYTSWDLGKFLNTECDVVYPSFVLGAGGRHFDESGRHRPKPSNISVLVSSYCKRRLQYKDLKHASSLCTTKNYISAILVIVRLSVWTCNFCCRNLIYSDNL